MGERADDATDTPTEASADASSVSVSSDAHCELLCFLQNKSMLMSFDQLVKLCADFYTRDEVVAARQLLEQHLPGVRLARRQGGSAARATVEDLLKHILNPNVKLPAFYATSMNRLPPVDATHCDVSAILKEMQALRAEVRASADLREEVCRLTNELKVVRCELNELRDNLALSQPADSLLALSEVQWPQLSTGSTDGDNVNTRAQSTVPVGKTFATHVQQMAAKPDAVKTKSVSKPVVGKSKDLKLKSVVTTRAVDLFVSRLHPSTVGSELRDCVESVAGLSKIAVVEIKCDKLKPRVEGLYSSFHVCIRVDAVELSRAVELFMSPESWPCGIFVKRYYKPKNGESRQ